MDIQYKSDHSMTRENVEPAILNQDAGWIKKYKYLVNFYPPTHWEPVEEWVDIQVNKKDWETMLGNLWYTNYGKENKIFGLKWRYPQ